ncbi:protein translocase subunit SecD [Candidatus Saccharibacteria bacterium]|nr:protein translocase subunit SecD [Candidatus Saccharibacteria bacterium]
MKLSTKLYLIAALAVVLVLLALPREDKLFSLLGIGDAKMNVRLGLDLQGGASLTYQADLSKTAAEDRAKAIQGVINVINKRVNPSGTSEVVVQTSGNDRISIQLPGVNDIDQAVGLIGKTAQLTFLSVGADNIPAATDINGEDLENATSDMNAETGQPIVVFQMKGGSIQKFADLTKRINQKNERLVIILDNEPLFNGTVSTPITDGKGEMTGFKGLKDAKATADLLNAGALPVPVSLVEQRTVGATLGAESIQRSLFAGLVGLVAVLVFMIIYYRLAGLVAAGALVIYSLITIDIFKLSGLTQSPIVLTLAGIAGFVLSIGMAVDANILIFERMKEEIRAGSSVAVGMDTGFKRAWTSIRDSNVSTLITCTILYISGIPIIRGFAVTLAIGVIVSMFTAITISRTLMQAVVRTKIGSKPSSYRIKMESETNQ